MHKITTPSDIQAGRGGSSVPQQGRHDGQPSVRPARCTCDQRRYKTSSARLQPVAVLPGNAKRVGLSSQYGVPSGNIGVGVPVGLRGGRNTTNTSMVHGATVKEEDADMSKEALAVVADFWRAASGQERSTQYGQEAEEGEDTSLQDMDPQVATQVQALELLLPCLRPALLERGRNEVALRRVADKLCRLSVHSINTQEQEVMTLFSGLLSRSHDAEPEERAARNALLRAMWEGFAAARMASRVDTSVIGPMLFELQRYRQQYRGRTLAALRTLLAAVQANRSEVAAKLVLLRTMLKGSLSQLVLRHPELVSADVHSLRAIAQQVEGKPLEAASLIDQQAGQQQP